MSEALIGRLFQAFSQADASTAHEFGGTGLSLTTSRRLVELMGGQPAFLTGSRLRRRIYLHLRR